MDWEDIENLTKMFAQGGTTYILNHPFLTHESYKKEPLKNLKE